MIKKLFLLILFILALAIPSWAAGPWYGTTGGGNWNAATSWSATSNCTSSCGGSVPAVGDGVILDSHSGSITITAAGATGASLTMTGYTGTLAMGIYSLTIAGNVTLGGTLTGTGSFSISAASTITSNSIAFPAILTLSSSSTYTLVGNLTATTELYIQANTVVIAGAYNITCGTFYANFSSTATLTLVTGQTLTATTITLLNSPSNLGALGVFTIQSSTGTPTGIVYNGSLANQRIMGVTFTNVTVSGSGSPLYNWFGLGSGNTNITNISTANMPCGGTSGPRWGF